MRVIASVSHPQLLCLALITVRAGISGNASADLRWYHKHAKSYTARWTRPSQPVPRAAVASRPSRSAFIPNGLGSCPRYPRVPSWETYKMVARLQATGSKNPILMRVSFDSGHGIGESLSERDQQMADVMLFLFDQLGVKYKPVRHEAKSGKAVPSL